MFAVETSVVDQWCMVWELTTWTMTHHSITLKNHIQQWQYLSFDGFSFTGCWWLDPEGTGPLHRLLWESSHAL